jgi:hypothetical protein
VDGGLAGAIIAIGFVIMGWLGLPQAKWFLVGAMSLGLLFGLILRWKHQAHGGTQK